MNQNNADAAAPQLHGWDDEKVYLWVPNRGDFCVSDHPELVERLVAICLEYVNGIPRSGEA